MAINSLQDKLVLELSAMHNAETQTLEAQQMMLQQASDQTLKSGLQKHIGETQQQIGNLEQIFSTMGQQPQSVTCVATQGLVREGQMLMQEAAGNPAVLDCIIAGASAKVEHHEIASYRGLLATAQAMGRQDALPLLQQNLQQEENTARQIEQAMPQLLQKAM